MALSGVLILLVVLFTAHEISSLTHRSLKQRSCIDSKSFYPKSGLVKLYIGEEPVTAYCDQSHTNTSWLTVLRRDGSGEPFSTDEPFFSRSWQHYKMGFGDPLHSFWFGLENLHLLTKHQQMVLRVELEDFDGNTHFAEYSYFAVSSEDDAYRLFIAGYTGDARDSLGYHNGQRFSTVYRDNDINSGNCAKIYEGAWWYKSCVVSCLTGQYLEGDHNKPHHGIYWETFKGPKYSYKRAEMKIRPI